MAGPVRGYEIREYLRDDGNSPFRDWLEDLSVSTHARVQARIARFEAGNIGDTKSVGGGVQEARFHFGPGYRLYFGVDGQSVILLLCGGDKGSQRNDIRRAQRFWKDYLARGET
jgi:putative addiction module killer protein